MGSGKEKAWAVSWTYGRSEPASPFGLDSSTSGKAEKQGEQMQPLRWQPPGEFSIQEEQIVRRIRKAKLFVFLRQDRHILLDEPFQEELANLYQKQARGRPKVGPGDARASRSSWKRTPVSLMMR